MKLFSVYGSYWDDAGFFGTFSTKSSALERIGEAKTEGEGEYSRYDFVVIEHELGQHISPEDYL